MRTSVVVVALLLVVLGATAAEARPLVRRFATAKGGEETGTLVVPTGTPYTFQRLFRVDVRDVIIGDVIDVSAQFEVTNNLGFNVMLAHFLSVNGTDDHIAPAYPAGENVTPGMHHGYRSVQGSLDVTEELLHRLGGSTTVPVELYAYAASDVAAAGDTIVVERGYGGLTALRLAASP